MKFDFFGIILMIVAIALGNMIGGTMAGMVGFGGGILGAIMVGAVVYVIYTLIVGGKLDLQAGAIFALLVYVAQLVAGMMGTFAGVSGGILGLVFTSIVLSILWGFVGGKQAKKTAPIQL